MGVAIYQVDAFTSEPYKGNPAAVCLLEETRSEVWMQSVATEMNLSETAFYRSRVRRGCEERFTGFRPISQDTLPRHYSDCFISL